MHSKITHFIPSALSPLNYPQYCTCSHTAKLEKAAPYFQSSGFKTLRNSTDKVLVSVYFLQPSKNNKNWQIIKINTLITFSFLCLCSFLVLCFSLFFLCFSLLLGPGKLVGTTGSCCQEGPKAQKIKTEPKNMTRRVIVILQCFPSHRIVSKRQTHASMLANGNEMPKTANCNLPTPVKCLCSLLLKEMTKLALCLYYIFFILACIELHQNW